MPMKPDGTWEPEDDLVSPRLSGLLAESSPLMKQAQTLGKQQANRRGLLNSSIAVGAAQNEMIKAALPIASQEASQIHQKNLASMDIGSRERMQGRDIEAQKERLQMELGSQAALQAAELAAAKERLGMTLSSEEQRQLADLNAAKERLGMQIQSEQQMQSAEHQAQMARLQAELGSAAALQEAQIAAEKERLGMELTSREQLALADLNAAKERLGMQIESEQQIAAMNVASNDREKAAALTAAIQNAYLSSWQSIANNTDIPAAAREQYFTHLKTIFNSQMGLLEQLYGIDLEWAGEPAA